MATSTSSVGKFLRQLSIRKNTGNVKKKRLIPSRTQSLKMQFEFKDTEIPLKPCSVQQIRDYIVNDMLKEAYLNLLSLCLELQQQRAALGEGTCPMDLVSKETDIITLFETLRNKMADIVCSSSLPSSQNKELLMYVATIILEEEKRQMKPGGMPGWMEAWRDAVQDGVRDTLKKVPLDSREQNTSWLAVHLGLLGKTIVEDLKRVEAELLSSYPADFKVFETYVSCHHEAVGEHLKRLLEHVTEVKDYYALLEFIIHRYPSEKIMGSFSILREEQRGLKLAEDCLNKIKNSLCHRLKEDFTAALENIIKIEREEVWRIKKTPDRTDNRFLTSQIHTDISQLIASYADNLKNVDENLRNSVVCFSLEEINQFLRRFEKEFSQNTCSLLTSDLLDSCLWVEYHITYMNSLNLLKEHVLCYKESCSAQVEQLEKEVDGLTQRLSQTLIEHFKADIKPYINGMMTKKWLETDEDFNEVISRIESYSGHCKSMRNPSAQFFVNDVHNYVVKEYVSQLMMQKYSCKNTKKEDAAVKIKEQWNELNKLFEEMGSSFHWLYPVGYYLSDIIGMDNLKNIKDILNPLVSNYPDISKKHLSAILNFRGTGFGLEKQHVIKQFILLKKDAGNTNHEHSFFADMK
ncbi:exocyst complex component 3-like protein 4 [Myxocyprinus asiaticus]|uniref:exocyst complex component 3-like protein 4 n=1 Tax=Myxocyprinus asiaticus TaxID=70543 RepID=UPI002222CC59|nr:exocyst complex component 3-like protein 4 [Myxocyprinus asiaticus]XP_051506637.1 exocyst complex component 3-like protein 4 [Myxocyprinus asiaticus]